MDNREIAKVFADIAVLLQLKGERVFKTRAYRRASEIASHHPRDLTALSEEQGELKAIPGIGDAIASKIQELSRTGRLEFYENLKAEFPAGLLSIMEIPGVGPKTALRAAEELGISTVEELERSIEAGRFEELPRVGQKNAQKILRHLRSQRRQSDRVMLGFALPVAERLIEQLREACPEARDLTIAGSARRWKETVGDLDILCTADNPARVTAAFAALPEVVEVLGRGETKVSVVLKNGLQVDLRVSAGEHFGTLLLYFTGSQQHSIQLRSRAQAMGLSLNEYRLTDAESGVVETFSTEEAIYERLGLAFIPPELREDLSEIEAAASGELPHLILLDQIKGDLHVHSDWSDGNAPVDEMVRTAKALGREYIALTDHSAGRGVANGLSVERLRRHNEMLVRVEAEIGGIRVFKGTEVDIRADGSLDYPDDVLGELDVVVACVHSAMGQEPAVMTRRIIKAMRNPHVTIIGHLTTRLLYDGTRSRDPIEADFDELFQVAADTGTLLEINASPQRLDLGDAHARRARELGARFVIDTDAHSVDSLEDMRYGVGTARRGWCETIDVANALPAAEFAALLTTPKPERLKELPARV